MTTRLPVFQQGQPLDYAFISSMIETINALADNINATPEKGTSLIKNTSTTNAQLKFFATAKNVVAANRSKGASETINISFNRLFTDVPTVTLTPIYNSQNNRADVAPNINIVITNITESVVDCVVYFNNAKTLENVGLDISVIAIGV